MQRIGLIIQNEVDTPNNKKYHFKRDKMRLHSKLCTNIDKKC
jgi:hypothetical protein